MGNVGVQIVFEKYKCKMVWGAMLLMRGVWCATLYKFLGRTVIDKYNDSIVLESKNKERKILNVSGGDTMLCHWRLGHIGDKGIQSFQGKGMVEGMSNFNSNFYLCEHCVYGKKN